MSLIDEKSQYYTFTSYILPELKEDEVYFVSLSARNKYLSQEERQRYCLGRTEMFARTLVRSKAELADVMDKLASERHLKRTKTGHQIPLKALVTYFNINPSSSVRAMLLFQKKMADMIGETMLGLLNNSSPNVESYRRIDRMLMNCFQKSPGHKTWVDIDMDVAKKDRQYLAFTTLFRSHGIRFAVIETKNGYHVLVHTVDLKEKAKTMPVKLHEVVKDCHNTESSFGGEVVFNSNGMVPLPGTLQSRFPVSIAEISPLCLQQ